MTIEKANEVVVIMKKISRLERVLAFNSEAKNDPFSLFEAAMEANEQKAKGLFANLKDECGEIISSEIESLKKQIEQIK